MPETAAHKKYMKQYRERKKTEEATSPEKTPEAWRTRRHRTTRADGTLTTGHLFELRSQIGITTEQRALTYEEWLRRERIERELRNRGELAAQAGPVLYDWEAFYTDLYQRRGLTRYLPRVLDELVTS